MSKIKSLSIGLFTALIYFTLTQAAMADVVGTLGNVTNWLVIIIRAAAAIFIIVFLVMAASGRGSVGGGLLCIGCIAAAIEAPTLAAMIQ